MDYATIHKIPLYSATSLTTTANGLVIPIPSNLSRWRLVIDATNIAAGSFTSQISGTETNAVGVNAFAINTPIVISATGTSRTNDTTAGTVPFLPQYVYFAITALTGTWTLTADLYYSRRD